MNEYLDLFGTFAKVGVMTFGGGYAMLPITSPSASAPPASSPSTPPPLSVRSTGAG